MVGSPDYINLSDEELLSLYKNGDELALNFLTLRYFKPHGEKFGAGYLDGEDLFQEGMFGFLSAVKSYNGEKGIPFSAYARVCINNCIRNAVKKTQNDFLPVDVDASSVDECDAFSLQNSLESNEELKEVLFQCEKVLTDTEKTVVFYRMGGLSYDEIARKLGLPRKSVDNALMRARNKLKEVLSS